MSYASLVKTGPPPTAAAAVSANQGDASGKADGGRPRGYAGPQVAKSVGEAAKADEVKPTQQVIARF